MSQKQFQEEFLRILDESIAESDALAKKYLKDGMDSHPAEFKAIRDKHYKRVQELCLKHGVKPEEVKNE
ncbi:MAG TPA: hypothetical protein PLR50_01015 [Candidatus Rifleibacterium sp.]|nr:hypothetical protein [Candidatus Rifleibacterium sp.]HQB82048.1 hypothetical protein [Candidatus Rifleibacterium sp.]